MQNNDNFFPLEILHVNWLVPDDTVRMVTSKYHKNNLKHPSCGAHVSFNFWNEKN